MTLKNSDPNVKTALRVTEIIEIFAREQKPLSLSEIAGHLCAPVSSCRALLKTLNEAGYLYETAAPKDYYPTGRLLAMAQQISDADPILKTVSSSLHDLCEATTETIIFARMQHDDRVMFLQIVDSPQPIRYVATAGTQRDIHTNAMGKALLSTLEASTRHKLLSARPLSRLSENTVTDLIQIENDIQQSLQRGWFESLGDMLPGVGTIAWPVRIAGNSYAISVAGPLFRIEPNIADLVQKLRLVCASLDQTA